MSTSTPSTTSPSARSRVLVAVLRASGIRNRQFDPHRVAAAPGGRREGLEASPGRAVARRVTVARREVEGWPVYTLTPRSGGGSGEVLFLHGGAHSNEIQSGHWSFAARLSERTDRRVTVPIYPLVPAVTHREVMPVLRRLAAQVAADAGTPERLAVAGDSSGAGMGLGLIQSWPASTTRPGDLVLMTPWLDLTTSSPAVLAAAPTDPLLRPDHLRELGRLYAGADDPTAPEVSSLNGALDGLGRVLILAGGRDLLADDARRLHRRASGAHGTEVTLVEVPGMPHDWFLMPIPEAATAMDHVVDALTQP